MCGQAVGEGRRPGALSGRELRSAVGARVAMRLAGA